MIEGNRTVQLGGTTLLQTPLQGPGFLTPICLPTLGHYPDLCGSNWHKHVNGKGEKSVQDTWSLFIGLDLEVAHI